jgi:transcriptional regulator with XRE-family HTH domain
MNDTVNYRQNWADYLRHMMGDRSQAEFAKAIQTPDGQLSKWLSGSTGVTAEKVIAIARLLNDSPVHALARVGWLSVAELTPFRVPRTYGLNEFEDRELAKEIVRRIDNGEAAHWLTDPVDTEPTDLNAHRDRRGNVPAPVDTIDHTDAPDLESLDYAAKRGVRKADAAPWAE